MTDHSCCFVATGNFSVAIELISSQKKKKKSPKFRPLGIGMSQLDTSSFYSFEAMVIRVLPKLESFNLNHKNLRYVLNNRDCYVFKIE